MSHIFLVIHSSNPSWEILKPLGLDDCNKCVCCNMAIVNLRISLIWKMSNGRSDAQIKSIISSLENKYTFGKSSIVCVFYCGGDGS